MVCAGARLELQPLLRPLHLLSLPLPLALGLGEADGPLLVIEDTAQVHAHAAGEGYSNIEEDFQDCNIGETSNLPEALFEPAARAVAAELGPELGLEGGVDGTGAGPPTDRQPLPVIPRLGRG